MADDKSQNDVVLIAMGETIHVYELSFEGGIPLPVMQLAGVRAYFFFDFIFSMCLTAFESDVFRSVF